MFVPPEFKVIIDQEKCIRCKACTIQCSFEALSFSDEEGQIIADNNKCVCCQRCMAMCPTKAISVIKNPIVYAPHPTWTEEKRRDIYIQAQTGSAILTGVGSTQSTIPYLFDHLLLDACQVTNPAIDAIREPMELRTYIGRKPRRLEFKSLNEDYELKTEIAPNLLMETPIMIAGMSYGAISLEAHKACAMAAKEQGTFFNSGEGGLHTDQYIYGDHIIVQVASGRFGVHMDYLNVAAAVEIKIGQGAKPGMGGHLPGEKITEPISQTRMIPVGTDALSPAPQHDIYSIEDLSQLIYAIKEATRYEKPVLVKISAVHNSAAIASGIVRGGADAVVIDGFRGSTGAAPKVAEDHIGIPIAAAIAAVDDRLCNEGIRDEASLIASGGIRCAGDIAKAIALGADAVAIGMSVLIAMGCRICKKCYTGRCPWGIATQRPELRKRLNIEIAAKRVSNLLAAWSLELKEILGANGMNSIESLRGNRERLRAVGLDQPTLDVLGVKPAGR